MPRRRPSGRDRSYTAADAIMRCDLGRSAPEVIHIRPWGLSDSSSPQGKSPTSNPNCPRGLREAAPGEKRCGTGLSTGVKR